MGAFLRTYRTYRFIDKDPVIDEMRTLVKDEGLMGKLTIVSQLSGVSVATLENWFKGDTKSPQNRTICAVTSSLGYKREWAKDREIEIDAELRLAKAWKARQDKLRDETEKRVAKRKPTRTEHRARST